MTSKKITRHNDDVIIVNLLLSNLAIHNKRTFFCVAELSLLGACKTLINFAVHIVRINYVYQPNNMWQCSRPIFYQKCE